MRLIHQRVKRTHAPVDVLLTPPFPSTNIPFW